MVLAIKVLSWFCVEITGYYAITLIVLVRTIANQHEDGVQLENKSQNMVAKRQ